MRDEIIDEVHAIKESLAEAVGYDIRRIVEDIKRCEAQTELEGWHHVQPAAAATIGIPANPLRPPLT